MNACSTCRCDAPRHFYATRRDLANLVGLEENILVWSTSSSGSSSNHASSSSIFSIFFLYTTKIVSTGDSESKCLCSDVTRVPTIHLTFSQRHQDALRGTPVETKPSVAKTKGCRRATKTSISPEGSRSKRKSKMESSRWRRRGMTQDA
jgi:hypothetical protein